jgi:hypothetical protein
MLSEICIFHANIVAASLVGIVKTVLIIIGSMVVLRFIGQLMIAKRNAEEERVLNKRVSDLEKERLYKLKNFGKVKIQKSNLSTQKKETSHETEDVSYEEI